MMQQASNSGTTQQFSAGLPQYYKENQIPIEFEISLVGRGEIPAGTVIRACVDDSQQYMAEGRCWRATAACHMVAVGQRIERYHVAGWREIQK